MKLSTIVDRFYEVPVVFSEDVSLQVISSITSKISDIVSKLYGNIIKVEYWGFRDLAYKIGKNKKGRYYCFFINSNSELPDTLSPYFNTNEFVIRYLIISIDKDSKSLKSDSTMLLEFKKNNAELSSDDKEHIAIMQSVLSLDNNKQNINS